jgi:two-component system CheB/CheR fusion protein
MLEEQVEEILTLVAQRRGIDFRDYRRETLRRRAELRVQATGCANLGSYCSYLLENGDEVDRLVEALVVPVTSFFRDAWIFRELAERVLPPLAARNPFLHAWVAGAATGEEAYSLAMLLAEVCARHRGNGFEVIASDLNRVSLERARRGVYPIEAAADVPGDLRTRYLRCEANTVRVVDSIRDRIRFGEHDLVGTSLAPREAVVATFDVVFCRNVLLYFKDSLRATAGQRLAAVLEPGGTLTIGTSEVLPEKVATLFEPYPGVAAGAGIYRRSGA